MWLRNGNQAEKACASVYVRRNKRETLNADYCKILNQLDVQLTSWRNVNKIIIILIIALIYEGLLTTVSYTAPQALQAQLISSLPYKLCKLLETIYKSENGNRDNDWSHKARFKSWRQILNSGSLLKLSIIIFIIELIIRIFPHVASNQLCDSARDCK